MCAEVNTEKCAVECERQGKRRRKQVTVWFPGLYEKGFLFVMSVITSFLNFEVQNSPRRDELLRMNQLKSFHLLDYG